MFINIRKKIRSKISDAGDSIVSAVIVFPLLFMIIITGIDSSMYFANRAQVQAVARDAARTVAIMGGNGTATKATPIEKAYGQSRAEACRGFPSEAGAAKDAFKSTTTAIECNLIRGLINQKGLLNTHFKSVECTPDEATSVGNRVSCEVVWDYGGIPASAISFMELGHDTNTLGVAESEVGFKESSLVSR